MPLFVKLWCLLVCQLLCMTMIGLRLDLGEVTPTPTPMPTQAPAICSNPKIAQAYQLLLTRPPSLKSLTIPNIQMFPNFEPNVLEYTANVCFQKKDLPILVEPMDSNGPDPLIALIDTSQKNVSSEAFKVCNLYQTITYEVAHIAFLKGIVWRKVLWSQAVFLVVLVIDHHLLIALGTNWTGFANTHCDHTLRSGTKQSESGCPNLQQAPQHHILH